MKIEIESAPPVKKNGNRDDRWKSFVRWTLIASVPLLVALAIHFRLGRRRELGMGKRGIEASNGSNGTRIRKRSIGDDGGEGKKFRLVDVAADGNCQFHALAYGLRKIPGYKSVTHENVRKEVVRVLVNMEEDSKGVVEAVNAMDFKRYVKTMNRDGTWGDEHTLKAAAEAFGVFVSVHSPHFQRRTYPPTKRKDSPGKRTGHKRTVDVYHDGNNHYLAMDMVS